MFFRYYMWGTYHKELKRKNGKLKEKKNQEQQRWPVPHKISWCLPQEPGTCHIVIYLLTKASPLPFIATPAKTMAPAT
jgi:hypothetical protein